MRIVSNNNFKYGVIDSIEARSIPRGASSSSLNWQHKGDHIELRRGAKFLGESSVNTGSGRASGIKKVIDAAGIEQLFASYGKKVKHFNRTTEEWEENGSDLLGSDIVDANGISKDTVFFAEYVSPAGNQLWVSSPHAVGLFKMMVANPTSAAKDMYSSAVNFLGHIKIDLSRMLLWRRKESPSSIYGSYIDDQGYTTVAAEVLGTGDGVTLTFTDTAAAISSVRTIFAIAIKVNGTQVAVDDYNGVITGTGITGTVNYITGEISVTWTAAPAGGAALTWDYQWENSNANGISDFTKSATRTAGQGFVFDQGTGGGDAMSILVFSGTYYCMHIKNTYALNIDVTDLAATNLPYRQRVGIPSERAAAETGDGIYYIDAADSSDIKIRVLAYGLYGSTQVVPIAISNNIDLSGYIFDDAAGFEWGDYIFFACATSDSVRTIDGETRALNNRTIAYNKVWKSIDILDYAMTCFESYDGTLVGGHAYSNNFMTLFSEYDDPVGVVLDNYWIGKIDDLDLEGLKKSKKLYLEGLIQADQNIEVYLSLDEGAFVLVGTISGQGTYVDTANPVTIGSPTLGTNAIGGSGEDTAYHYERLFSVQVDKFETARIKYIATDLGFASVSTQKWWDVRPKGQKVPTQYRG